ncbi:NAD(P)/FAD-dependent oxidoreductase [Ideonella livida]|uniref:FAD-dependent oxidoreductase n=1 Tax=Ideonella livida TaxID=2707176 RepID=A0A7C9TKR8_9BURK|nr:FAD-dependent oxidoreductase [Ideonella livida]NDY91964.1 FAD-dependent oxidoreductase [Ideonella livida]
MNAPFQPPRRVAVVGAGISGLSAAWHLRREQPQTHVTLLEAGHHFGGHANTVDLTLDGVTHGVDTGFLVFNQRTYPGLIRLFEQLQVPTADSDMSFSVQAPAEGLEWSGSDLNTVFAQRGNLLRPRFWGMLADILRFNRLTTALALAGEDAALAEPMQEFLDRHRFGTAFRQGYLLPMIACIWSCPLEQMLQFPVGTLIRFCHNHGLLQVQDRPQWRTVAGGSREYVRRMLASLPDARLATPVRAVQPPTPDSTDRGVWVVTDHGRERFDAVVLACHSPQALALLERPTTAEREILGALRTQPNRAVLHTDASVLPSRPLAWAAWNYERASRAEDEQARVCLHYLLNRLQPLPWTRPVIVSLNPVRPLDPAQVHAEFSYAHPVFDLAAVAAQRRLHEIQGQRQVWFCGAWTGYGFHEDGLRAGQAVVDGLRGAWRVGAAAPHLSLAA